MPGIFCMSQKNSQQVFLLALRKKTLGQFFPSFACFAHKKLSAESRPSAESWLVAGVNRRVSAESWPKTLGVGASTYAISAKKKW